MLLDVIIAQTKTDLQHRNPDLARAAGFYGLELAQPPTPPVFGGWALCPLAKQCGCLKVYTTHPMRSTSGRRSVLPTTLSPYLLGMCCWESWQVTQLQQLCEIFWLQEHREVTWKRQKQEMVRGQLGICSAGWRDSWIQKQQWFWPGLVW
jgi:hypothetical protein